jgi:phosphate transport system protein
VAEQGQGAWKKNGPQQQLQSDVDAPEKCRFAEQEAVCLRARMRDQNHPDQVGEIINMYLISRHLERMGDHTTNIAEEVIYLVEGEIIRHR